MNYYSVFKQGGSPDEEKRKEIAAKKPLLFWNFRKVVMQKTLDVPYNYFWKNCCVIKVSVGRLILAIKELTEKMQEMVLILMLN
jgi:hypothetical protein